MHASTMSPWACLTSLLLFACLANANTEKIIFIAPSKINLPDHGPGLQDLNLISLSPKHLSQRLALPVVFPTQQHSKGRESWYLLENLQEHQRYEVRICWSAVQPTIFDLETYELQQVFDSPDLINSLAAFTEGLDTPSSADIKSHLADNRESLLFLRIRSAADYFTTNGTLMQYPPPVDVDIILDPYLANIFPKSLERTALYIILLVTGSWWLSRVLWRRFFAAKTHED